MKILHLIQKPQYRGAETFTCQLANHQKKLGHDVKIACIFNGEAKLNWDDEIINLDGAASSRLLDLKAWRKLSLYIKYFKPDIIQANAGDTLKYAVLSKKLFGWKVPIVFRNASEVGRYLTSGIQKVFNRFLYSYTSKVISVSRASEMDILKHFPFLEGKTTVIPIGLENIENIESLQLKPKNLYHVLHVGGFSFEKNHEALLRIFKKVSEGNQNVHLHLVGDGPLRMKIEKLSHELSLNDKITFYGFVNNPLTFIQAADMLVLPSIIEGLPGVILESMYCETPVIAYNVGGISEILTDKTGTLIPANNEEQFAEAIIEGLRNRNSEKINFAREIVRTKYLNKEISKDFLACYLKITS